jgi:uncharacterized membrane protein YedE/YeeE
MGSAVLLGIVGVKVIKQKNIEPLDGSDMSLEPKDKSVTRYLAGGIIFGLGWALAGVCPGPMYTLAGAGYISILIVILGALLGTLIYGVLRKYLPH